MNLRTKKSLPLLILLSVLLFAGCSAWSRLTGEFSAYFNTYHNAKAIFKQVEESLLKRSIAEKFPTIEKFDAEFNLPQGDKSKLDDVIKKCSKILQYHLNTSLGDDALLMIGKSYLYQDNYLGAERKFAELISTFPQSDLYMESLYLFMLTLLKEKKYEDAIIFFQTKAKHDRKNKSAWKLYKVYGIANYRIGQVDSAIYYLDLASKQAKGEDKAKILFYIAELNESRNPAESAKFYLSASKATKITNFKTYSLIKYAVQQRKLGNYEISERVLKDLIDSNPDKDYERKAYLELARTHAQTGKFDLAIQTYIYLDTTYKRTEESAIGYFELGQIYETKFGKYDSARIFYEKAQFEFPYSEVSRQAQKKVATLNDYFRYKTMISKNDSVLKLIQEHSNSTKTPNVDSIQNLTAQAKYSLAWIFYNFLNKTDSAIFYLKDIIETHPKSLITPRSYYLLGTIYETIDTSKAKEIYFELVNRFPDSEFSHQVVKFIGLKLETTIDTLEQLYKEAISLVDFSPEDAIKILSIVYNTSSNLHLKAKASFAIGWINEYKLKNFSKAIEHYTNVLNNYPESEYARIVQGKLNPEKYELQKSTSPQIQFPTLQEQEKPIIRNPEDLDNELQQTRERRKRRIDDN